MKKRKTLDPNVIHPITGCQKRLLKYTIVFLLLLLGCYFKQKDNAD